jgi:hypothetical protein
MLDFSSTHDDNNVKNTLIYPSPYHSLSCNYSHDLTTSLVNNAHSTPYTHLSIYHYLSNDNTHNISNLNSSSSPMIPYKTPFHHYNPPYSTYSYSHACQTYLYPTSTTSSTIPSYPTFSMLSLLKTTYYAPSQNYLANSTISPIPPTHSN